MKKLILLSVLLIGGCDKTPTISTDCAGVAGGTAVEDCNGDCNGMASINSCDICTGGTTSYHTNYCGTVSDIGGNVYETVKIGAQTWMSENLQTTQYRDSSAILTGLINSVSDEWINTNEGAYVVYDDDLSNAAIYGNLYNWSAINDIRGICPIGFHIPSDEEWMLLEIFLGMSEEEVNSNVLENEPWSDWRGTNEGSKLAGNTDLWNDGNLENDSEFGSSGFNVIPAGSFNGGLGSGRQMGESAYFASSSECEECLQICTQYTCDGLWTRILNYDHAQIKRQVTFKKWASAAYGFNGFSVRCLKD